MVQRKMAILVLIVFMVVGCQALKQVAGISSTDDKALKVAVQGLEAAKATYESAMTIAGQLHCDGKLTDEQAISIINKAGVFYKGYKKAADLVAKWEAGDNAVAALAEIAVSELDVEGLKSFVKSVTGKDIG